MVDSDVSPPWSVGSWGSGESTSSVSLEASTHHETSSRSSIVSETLDDARTVVRNALGPIPEVTVEFFLEYIVPNSNVDVEATMTKLKEQNMLSDDSSWNIFQGRSPQGSSDTKISPEDQDTNNMKIESLSKMKNVYDSIISHTRFRDRSMKKQTLTFGNLPIAPTGPDSGVDNGPKLHGALMPEQEIHTKHLNVPLIRDDGRPSSNPQLSPDFDGKTTWFDTACVWAHRVKSRTVDLNENVLDLVWSLHHIMQVDHRRRYIFGISAEKEETRIWFTCRQVLFVSRPFNANTHASQLVQLVASLAYATPTQLGYDPTMKLQWRNNTFHYDIECSTKEPDGSERTILYQTQKVISDTASDLRGRATRVYLALALDQNESSASDRLVVLKGSWIDADCPREGDTHRKLLAGASEEEKGLFLTVYQHGIVRVNNQDDSTQDLFLKGKKVQTISALDLFFGLEEGEEELAAKGCKIGIFNLYTPVNTKSAAPKQEFKTCPDVLRLHTFLAHHLAKEPNVYPPKVHYRIVYEEIGESLTRIANCGKATLRILEKVMFDITKALRYMAKRGYVHRDVSSGNILWFGDHAKLSDLEFAREYGTGGSSDARTGTCKFMAGEVMAGRYSVQGWNAQFVKVPFVYNPVHDLESLWWVGVWSTMYFYPAPCDKILHPLQQNESDNDGSPSSPRIEYKYKDYNNRQLRTLELLHYDAEEMFAVSRRDFAYFRMEEIHHEERFVSRLDREFSGLSAFTLFLNILRICISSAYTDIQDGLPRVEATYFVESLRIPTPAPLLKYDATLEGTEILVHDRIFQALRLVKESADFDDGVLWPIRYTHRYRKWLAAGGAQDMGTIEDSSSSVETECSESMDTGMKSDLNSHQD